MKKVYIAIAMLLCAFLMFGCSSKIDPIVTDAEFVNMVKEHFTTCEINSRSQDYIDGVYTDHIDFTASVEYEYLTVNFKGYYIYEYYEDNWYYSYDFWVDSADWSRLLGEWQFRDRSLNMGASFYSADLRLEILSLSETDENAMEIVYNYSSWLNDNSLGRVVVNEKGESISGTINIKNRTETIMGKEISIPSYASGFRIPWQGTTRILITLSRDGVYTKDILNGYTHNFNKLISIEDVQAAIDKGKDGN